MNNNYFFFGLIPAKKKSKRLRNKNLLKINNKTILEIAINETLSSKLINETYVSTNSKEIYNISLKSNSKAILRKKKYSSNKAPSLDVILIYKSIKFKKKEKFVYCIFATHFSFKRQKTY